jgi:hypothetical protein
MSSTETVKTFITALQSGDFELAANCVADDFVLSGWSPQPLDKGEVLAMQSELRDAMPDYSFHLSDLQEHDNQVEALIQISGTHRYDLALPMFGLPLIPYSGVAIDLPQVHTYFSLAGNKITEMHIEEMPGGGLTGLLQQVGTELPILPRLGNQDIKRLNESGETNI